jgi:hypothetical protein
MRINSRRGARRLIAGVAAATMVLGGVGVAAADQLRNDLTGAPGPRTIASGGTLTVTYELHATGGECNVDSTSPATVTVTAPNSTATPASFAFTSCGEGGKKTVEFTSAVVGTHSVTHAITGGKATNNGYNNNANFALIVNPSTPSQQFQTITFPEPASPVAYGDTFPVNPTSDSNLPVRVAASGVCEISDDTVTMTSGDGNCILTASQGGDDTYFAAQDVVRTVAAQKRAASVAPTDASKVYGEADPVLTGSLSGFLAADAVSAVYEREAGETVVDSPYIISATLSPSAVLANYSITYETADFVITPRPATVTPNGASKVYGEADPVLTGLLSGFLAADAVSAVYEREAGETVVDSPYIISATLSPVDVLTNYDVDYRTANFTINPRPITVAADDQSKVFGATDPVLTWRLTDGSLVGSDEIAGSLARQPGESVGSYEILRGTLSAGNNYTLTYVPANLTISAWDLSGFYRPVDMGNVWNTAKGGSTIPLKFEVFAGSVELDTTAAIGASLTSKKVSCPGGSAVTDEIDNALLATGNTALRYDSAEGQFIFNWKTPTGAGCYEVTVRTADGSFQTAKFSLRK